MESSLWVTVVLCNLKKMSPRNIFVKKLLFCVVAVHITEPE